ncbi:hypothetical protein LIA77_08151 [Sarocladium implicatum]|nr:hypothetical protein LIA77_08151 [Sarocladium implicatum]
MTATQAPEDHPVLKHLLQIHGNMQYCIQSQLGPFKSCLALAKTTKQRCKNPIAKHKSESATTFWKSAASLDAWPQPDDRFLAGVKTFVLNSHCSVHADDIIGGRFNEWRTSLVLLTSQPAAEVAVSWSTKLETEIVKAPRVVTVAEREVTNDEHVKDALVEPVVHKLSAMSVSSTTTFNRSLDAPDIGLSQATTAYIANFGKTALARTGSLRDPSPIFAELYKPLHSKQDCNGIVYVLKNSARDDLFKIGYTRSTVEGRLKQANNCWRSNSDVVSLYQSPSPFFAAHKAEQLAQVTLKNHRLDVKECAVCGGGHREWFRASESVVVETVRAMERFVRLPAYEQTEDGKWKLSDRYSSILKPTWHMDLANFVSLISGHDSMPQGEHSSRDQHCHIEDSSIVEEAPHITANLVDGDAFPPTVLTKDDTPCEYDSSSLSTGLPSQTTELRSGRSPGTVAASTVKGLAKGAKVMKTRGMEALRAAREKRDRNSIGSRSLLPAEPDNLGDVLADVLWSMVPEEARDGKAAPGGGVSFVQVGKAWTTRLKQAVRKQVEDYEREWHREDEAKRREMAAA